MASASATLAMMVAHVTETVVRKIATDTEHAKTTKAVRTSAGISRQRRTVTVIRGGLVHRADCEYAGVASTRWRQLMLIRLASNELPFELLGKYTFDFAKEHVLSSRCWAIVIYSTKNSPATLQRGFWRAPSNGLSTGPNFKPPGHNSTTDTQYEHSENIQSLAKARSQGFLLLLLKIACFVVSWVLGSFRQSVDG